MPEHHQSVSINYLLILANGLKKQGITEQQILEEIKLNQPPQRHATKRIPLATLLNHWHDAIAISQNPILPIQTGLNIHANDYNLVGTLAMNCSTFEEAIATGFEYEDLMSGCLPTLRFKEDHQLTLRLSCQDYERESISPFVEQNFAAQIRLGNLMTAGALAQSSMEVHFRHQAAGPQAEYESLLGVKVCFNMQYNQIVIPEDLLNIKLHAPCDEMRSTLQKRVSELQQLIQGNTAYKTKIANFIRHNLAQGIPTLKQAALAFNMSSATMKRKLSQENTSYRQICDSIRMTIAKQLLTDPDQKVSSIAKQLDYSSPTAFISAFKRWTQQTPLQYRQTAN